MKKKIKPFQVVNVLIMIFLIGITLYPMYYVVVASISDPILLKSHTGLLWKPLGEATLAGYQKTMFDKAENFCKGEYEGDTTALTTAMEDETATASVTLDAENGATLAKNVEKAYLKILTEGTASYQADGTEIYMSTELNMVDKSMKEIFGLSADAQASPELGELSDDDRQTLYNETMKFFEKLYGESTETYDTTDADSTETAGGEENAE